MANRSISPLAIRIQVNGSREGQNEIKATAATLGEVKEAAAGANRELGQTAQSSRQVMMASRGMATEIQDTEKSAKTLSERFKEGSSHLKEMVSDARQLAGHVQTAWSVFKALKSGSALGLADAILPTKKIGMGMIGTGVGLSLALGATIAPAMEKQSRLSAMEGLTGSAGASRFIYNQADQLSNKSDFDLTDLVLASKTLTKDKLFSGRNLKAVDDLAAANKDEGVNPQEVARALGRIRAGDTGEGFERLRDFGINKDELKAQGLKFDGNGALSDTSRAGIDKAVEAVVKIVETRFGGLSERLATTTLDGALSQLRDSFGRAATAIGEHLVPAVTWGVNTLNTLVNMFVQLPEPIHKVIAYGTGFVATLLIVGGTWLVVRGTLSTISFALKATNFVLGLFGTSIGQLAMQLLTKMLPAIGTVGIALGLIALIAGATYVAIKGMHDASTMSADELIKHWGMLGKFWVSASEWMDKVINHPLFKILFPGAYLLANAAGFTHDDSKATGNSRKDYDDYVAERKKHKKQAMSWEDWQKREDDDTSASPEQPSGPTADKAAFDKVQSGWQAPLPGAATPHDAAYYLSQLTGGGTGMTTNLPVGGPMAVGTAGAGGFSLSTAGMIPGGMGGLATAGGSVSTVAAAQARKDAAEAALKNIRGGGDVHSHAEIFALQNQIATAKANGDKDAADQLGKQLQAWRQANTVNKDANQEATAAAREELKAANDALRQAKIEAKTAERTSDKRAKLDASLQATIVHEESENEIAKLEAEKDSLKGAHHKAKKAALQFQIDSLKARQEFAEANERIAGMDDDDPYAKDIESRKAKRILDGKLQRAAIARDAAKSGLAALSGGLLPGASTTGGSGVAGERSTAGLTIGAGFDSNAFGGVTAGKSFADGIKQAMAQDTKERSRSMDASGNMVIELVTKVVIPRSNALSNARRTGAVKTR